MTEQWYNRSLSAHGEALNKKEYSAAELTRAFLARIEETDETVGAYLTRDGEGALRQAEASDARRARGETRGPLDGIPYAVKDNLCVKGLPTTCASRMLAGYVPPYDDLVIEMLREAGAVLLGKLNMDEFAMGSTTETSAVKPTRNPLELSRSPGGSSGGSAAAVAAGEAVFTLGSDTGGSVRQPAAFCGVVGMKPTWGAVSRYGLVAFASSLDQIGPLTASVGDNAIVLNALAGRDPRDATSKDAPCSDFRETLSAGVKGLRIGLPEECFRAPLSPDVSAAVLAAAREYRAMGAEILQVSMPSLDYALSAYYILSAAEASSNLGRFDGVRYGHRTERYADAEELIRRSRSEGFGDEVKRRIMLGTFVLSAGGREDYYQKALRVSAMVRADFDRVFGTCDLLLTPTAPTVACKLGVVRQDPTELYAGDFCGVPANLAGLPALSLPCGTGEAGLPVGLQLTGPAWSEALLYRAGAAYETRRKEVCHG